MLWAERRGGDYMVYYRGFHCVRIRFSPAKKISSLAGIISSLKNIISRETVEHSSQSRGGKYNREGSGLVLFFVCMVIDQK